MSDTQAPVSTSPVGRSVDDLQFQRAEAVPVGPDVQRCVGCKQPVTGAYFQAAGHTVCPLCADRIQKGTQPPPASSLARAALFGVGAALAGCAIYATVSIVTGFELGLIAILVGVMVGKAIRHASGGLGGRPQQILAVVLTYFAITTSYIPVAIYHFTSNPKPAATSNAAPSEPASPSGNNTPTKPSSAGALALFLIALAAAAPFMALSNGSGILSLFIIFIGLRQAWKLTGQAKILLMGPYPPAVPLADPATAG